MARYHLLLNRAAGGSERGVQMNDVRDLLSAALTEAGHGFAVTMVDPPEIDAALDRIISSRPDVLIIAGGDGTVAAAAGKLGGTGIAMGVLPLGTFNLAARDFGVPLDLPAAAKFLASAKEVDVDVLDVDGRACLCTLIFGFYPEFSGIFERRDHAGQWWRKTWKLISTAPRFFAQARPLRLVWKTPEASGRVRTKFASFVPGKYRETAGFVPARTGFRSGTLTAYLGTQRHAREAVRAMLDFIAGRHEGNPSLEIVVAEEMHLRVEGRSGCKVMLDGEIFRLPLPVRLKILPGHLRVLAELPTESS
jgi:diacylglycerol kinase family enzyme